MDFKKVNEALDAIIKGSKDAETVKALGSLKIDVGAVQQEAEKIESENKNLNDANKKLTEALKDQILSRGGKNLPGDGAPASEKTAKSFEEILAEKVKQANEKGK